jgi:hypothetical protein
MINTSWWHDNLTNLADQLSKGVLTEMKRRIQTSNIQREKLQLDEEFYKVCVRSLSEKSNDTPSERRLCG